MATALQRIDHAEALLGPVDIVGITELSPCWRPLLHAMATHIPVRWIAGPRPTPPWLDGDLIEIVREAPQTPEVAAISASTPYHEAIEALRWARELVSSGLADPADIAISAVSPGDYDDHLLALRADANLDLHFVHGTKVTARREGQAAAALADILMRGLSQSRIRRLSALLRAHPGPFQALPEGWTRVLPTEAPLTSAEAWTRLLERLSPADWPDGRDHGRTLCEIITLLSAGLQAAEEIGEALLQGRVRAIWRRALRDGPAASLDITLEALRHEDDGEACLSIAWLPASALAASPRRFVRLLGLNSSRWPRGLEEDRLLSDHIVPTAELYPLLGPDTGGAYDDLAFALPSNALATADKQRDGEAEAAAELCAHLIASETIVDHEAGEQRLCRPGDIALLAPRGSDLWRYEEALERRGIPVATQAGKGLYRRQEIQDLIAMTRVLADRRDTLALGALLRGPLVGLTEEELLDIVEALPRPEDAPDALPRLHLGVDPQTIAHPLARDIVEKLVALQRRVNATTPHASLCESVDVLRVRPILLARHSGQAERALANVDLYLSFSRAYAVRGLRAFAEAMTSAWTDESRAIEGRPDAQEESVALYTMHAAKGLEWPIVVPVNTMTRVRAPDRAIFDRDTGRLYFPVLGVEPAGHAAALETEKAELDRERVRLWYVAATVAVVEGPKT